MYSYTKAIIREAIIREENKLNEILTDATADNWNDAKLNRKRAEKNAHQRNIAEMKEALEKLG